MKGGGDNMSKLKRLLKEKNITQTELSKELGVHQTLISQWCHGKSKPNIYQTSAMAKYMNLSAEDIINCFEKESGVD